MSCFQIVMPVPGHCCMIVVNGHGEDAVPEDQEAAPSRGLTSAASCGKPWLWIVYLETAEWVSGLLLPCGMPSSLRLSCNSLPTPFSPRQAWISPLTPEPVAVGTDLF